MKKSQGLSIVFAIIMIALFSVFAFLYPIPHTTNFWLGYFFEIVAVVYLAINVWGISKSDDSKVRFLGMPTVLVAWIYVFIQTGVSLKRKRFTPKANRKIPLPKLTSRRNSADSLHLYTVKTPRNKCGSA